MFRRDEIEYSIWARGSDDDAANEKEQKLRGALRILARTKNRLKAGVGDNETFPQPQLFLARRMADLSGVGQGALSIVIVLAL